MRKMKDLSPSVADLFVHSLVQSTLVVLLRSPGMAVGMESCGSEICGMSQYGQWSSLSFSL